MSKSEFYRVFADSSHSLTAAKAAFPNARMDLRTTSPALLTTDRSSALGRHLSPPDIRRFFTEFGEISTSLHATLSKHDLLAPYALTIARSLLRSETWAFKAALLQEEDLDLPFVVAHLDTDTHHWLNGPWEKLLSTHGNYAGRVSVEQSRVEHLLSGEEENASFLQRLRFEPLESILFRALKPVFHRLPRSNKGTVLLCGLNGLMKEAGLSLGLQGYRVRSLSRPILHGTPLSEKEADAVRECLEPVLLPFWAKWTVAALVDRVVSELVRDCVESIQTYRAALPFWATRLRQEFNEGKGAILVNHFASPTGDALFHTARERGIPLCGVQHGTAFELTPLMQSLTAELDSSSCERFFVFSETAEDHVVQNPVNNCKPVAVGVPREMLTARKPAQPDMNVPPILYCTNQCYMGNMHRPVNFGIPDHEAHDYEVRLFDRVFSQLPHRVMYKPYPAFRYLDPDPSQVSASRHANIEVFQGRSDLRYLLRKARVLVVSLGHSTFTWCLLSGTPMVMIEQPDQNPLWDDMRSLIQAAMPTFSAGDENWHDALREYLAQPIELIEADYAARAPHRERLQTALAGKTDGQAGKRIARHIHDLIAPSQLRG